jgi:hypothetical protein
MPLEEESKGLMTVSLELISLRQQEKRNSSPLTQLLRSENGP